MKLDAFHVESYKTFDDSKASIVSGPGTQSSSLEGPGLFRTL